MDPRTAKYLGNPLKVIAMLIGGVTLVLNGHEGWGSVCLLAMVLLVLG